MEYLEERLNLLLVPSGSWSSTQAGKYFGWSCTKIRQLIAEGNLKPLAIYANCRKKRYYINDILKLFNTTKDKEIRLIKKGLNVK